MEEIYIALINKQPNLYELIGEINDLFSSPYKRDAIADNEIIQSLWFFLFEMFILSDNNDVKFDIISAMCDMYIYQANIGVDLSLDNIRFWRESLKAKESSPEIIDCVDDMLSI